MSDHLERFLALDHLLQASADLWRPQPFREVRPAWGEVRPQLLHRLLQLDDERQRQLAADEAARIRFLSDDIPALAQLHSLTQLPRRATREGAIGDPHLLWEIPGRKLAQIEAFAQALPEGEEPRPLIEWCGGKGHLGRLLSRQRGVAVTTLECNGDLCGAGEQLARRAGVEQRFIRVDVLDNPTPTLGAGYAAVGLHACGELHRTLLRRGVERKLAAIDIAPCCYAFGVEGRYRSLSGRGSLQLQRDDLRLAVTETVTAKPREVALRDREMAWKLGYIVLLQSLHGDSDYRSLKPIQKRWLRLDFADFCRTLAARDGEVLPAECDWQRFEALGEQRRREVARLSLLRHSFRRALELWLVLDMALYLEAQGYRVELATFCARATTPRNILLSARLRAGG